MATSQTARRISSHLFSPSANVCLRCQLRLSSHSLPSTTIPRASRRYASDTSASKWSQRLWRKPKEPPPEETSEAGVATQKAAEDIRRQEEGYEPATTWHGLPSIGGTQSSAWERDHVWQGFMSTVKLQSQPDISAAIYRALVEVFTLQNAGQDTMVRNPVGDDRGIEAMSGATLSQGRRGGVKVAYPNDDLRTEVVTALTTPLEEEAPPVDREESSLLEPTQDASMQEEIVDGLDSAAPKGTQPANEARLEDDDIFEPEEQEATSPVQTQTVEPPPPPAKASSKRAAWLALSDAIPVERWMNIRFPDDSMKFAIIKRVMQLTGQRIPDPAIQDINSAKALYQQLITKPKPKKLAERLTLNEQLVEAPNVQLRHRRWTPIDKEKEVGRWKVIEKELKERDLPVTGHM